MVDLLRTKLFIPRPRKKLVFRSRLVERLNAGLDKKLTLIAAPAGFGKTTLLSEWIPQSPRCVTWLFLDEGDNDPIQFWTYFIASLQGLNPDLASRAFANIQSPQAPPIKSILIELINDVTAFSDTFASVLDDYHFIDSQPIHEALSYLIDHLPANMHLVITTREDPPLPLARLRARDDLTEIRAQDLRFTQDEADAFLRGVMQLELSRQDVSALEDRTEGWAVGLQLAALSMQRQADIKAFIADFSGSHRHILDYLTGEVLQRQPEDIRSFLLQTAILDRLCGPLCDALTGRTDGSRLLMFLEAANLFVIPLDEERRWYRYHHLFADLLRNQLTHLQPELIPELHQRASRWNEAKGDIQAAIEHALQDTDLTRAADLIERHALQRLYQGEVPRVLGWFERLPPGILESSPMLWIGKAWALALWQRGLRQEEVKQALIAADLALDRVNANQALRDLVAGHVASIQAFLLPTPVLTNKEPERVIALSQEAQRLLPEEEKAIRSVTDLSIGYGYLVLADVETARRAYQMGLEDGLNGGNYYTAIYGSVNLVLCSLLVGNLSEALQLCDTNIKRFNKIHAGQHFLPIGALYVLKGSILLETDHLVEAEQLLMEGLELVRWTGESIAHRKGYAALARLRAIQGDRPGMLEAVKTLEEIWPEFALIAQALRQRLLMRYWPDDADVQKNAHAWLNQSAVKFSELAVMESVDPTSVTYLESYLNTASALAHLVKEKSGVYPVEDAQAYLIRQQEFAETHGFIHWVVAAAIARTLLYQAVEKKNEALETIEEALKAAASTGLFRIFVDERDSLQALLGELKPRLTDEALITYADRLLEAMGYVPPKSQSQEMYSQNLSEREIEVLRILAKGLTYEEIGRTLYLSLNTVQFHIKNIYSKLLVNKRVQAIEKARQMNLI